MNPVERSKPRPTRRSQKANQSFHRRRRRCHHRHLQQRRARNAKEQVSQNAIANDVSVECDKCYEEPEEEECESCGGSGVFIKKQKKKKQKDNRTYYDCTKCKDTGKYFEDFRGCNGFEVDCDECYM